jgi:membrane associated rhomboid family serine protease
MDQDHNAPPLNPLPWVVWALALPMIAMELVLTLAEAGVVGGPQGIGWRIQAVEKFGLFPELLKYQWETGGHPLPDLYRLVSYVVVHGSFTHALFAIVMCLALGKMVGESFRWWAVLIIFLVSAAIGGAAYGLLVPGITMQLIGAYPGVYGLIGAFTFLIWAGLARVGARKYRAFSLIGMLLGVQLLFGVLFGGTWEWVAEVTGFATGFLLSFVVGPGGFRRVLDQVRQR